MVWEAGIEQKAPCPKIIHSDVDSSYKTQAGDFSTLPLNHAWMRQLAITNALSRNDGQD